jgi:hypothetical protein
MTMMVKQKLGTLVLATVAVMGLGAASADALTIGTGRFASPGLAVDAAGTAYITWNGQENAMNVAPLRFCRLPRGAAACDAGAASAIVTPGNALDRAAVTVSGDRVVVVQSRYGGDVPGFTATYRFTSTNRGVSFGPGEVVGNVPFYETVTGPGDTLSGVPSASPLGMAFQNVVLSGASPVAMDGTSTVPRALLSATHVYYSSVGLIDASTPLAVFATGASLAQHRRYDGSGSLNDVANWTAPVDIGYADYAKLAGGPSGLFLLGGAADGSLFVRKWSGADFGAPVTIGTGNDATQHLFQDAAGRLHAVVERGDAAGRHLIHAVSDDGTTWRSGKLVTTTSASDGFGGLRVATAADHIGYAVWLGEGYEVRVAALGPEAPVDPLPPPPPPPVTPPVRDLTAPVTTLSGSLLQKLAKTVYVTVACPVEACSATVSATVRVPRLGATRAKVYKLKTLKRSIARGAKRKIALRMATTSTRAARRALRLRKKVLVRFKITTADVAGNKKTRTRDVRLKR